MPNPKHGRFRANLGAIDSAASHTRVLYYRHASGKIDMVGASHFSAQCCDNTGNTRPCRKMTAETYPWILNIADLSHNLRNTAKMVAEIPTVKLTN
jgi:hypothetical protein